MKCGDSGRIQDILAAIADIRSDTAGMDGFGFSRSPQTIRAVLLSIAVIGDGAANLSDDFKSAMPEIPWRALAGMRSRVLQLHWRNNAARIWEVVTDDLDLLEAVLRPH